MNNTSLITQYDLSHLKRLSLEDIKEAFYKQRKIGGFYIIGLMIDQEGLKHIELFHVHTHAKLKMDRDGWIKLMN